MYTTYDQITIAPYKIESLQKLSITKKLNDHSFLYLKAIVSEEEKETPIYETKAGGQIKVYADTVEPKLLFQGMVTSIQISCSGQLYCLELFGASNTLKMDLKLNSRSFQDKELPYRALAKQIVAGYGGDIIDTLSKGAATKTFLMQYQETDWEFLKRLASFLKGGLVPDVTFEDPKCFFGLPQGEIRGTLEQYNYRVTKNITDYLEVKENDNPGLSDIDRVMYEIETGDFYNIGDPVVYQNKSLVIQEVKTEMKEALLQNHYTLTTRKGCAQRTIYNEKITGLSIQGTVLDAITDKLKLQLAIEEHQDAGSAHLFPYTTMYTASGNSGWYCMPELGDTVLAYFPTQKEWEGVIVNSLRSKEDAGDKLSDPQIKYLRTKYGKELKFAPGEILITCVEEEIYVKLNDKTGIELYSTKPIHVHTQEHLSFEADQQIYLTAKEAIQMTCKSSRMKLDGNITIEGKEIKNN